MTGQIMFLDCPAYLDEAGAVSCGLPAEVTSRFVVRSSDGPVENARIRCPSGHWFNAPIEFLVQKHDEPRNAITRLSSYSQARGDLRD